MAAGREAKEDAWRLLEAAYPDLAAASHRGRIYISGMCICAAACRLPVGEGADRVR